MDDNGTSVALEPGTVAWASLSPTEGREQRGHRPVVIVAGAGYLKSVTTLGLVVPITTVQRGWPNHIVLDGPTGLGEASWAMTEQIRTIARTRITRSSGRVSHECLHEIRCWLADFLELPQPEL